MAKRKEKKKKKRRRGRKQVHTSRFADRGAHFSKFEGRGLSIEAQKHPKILASRAASRDAACIIQKAVRACFLLTVFTYVVHTARVCALTSLCPSSWRGRYGARVPPRAPRTDTRHRAAAPLLATVQPYTPYTRAFSHTSYV